MTGTRAEHKRMVYEELRKGVMPCRFCGLDWLWDGNRHDPLRMAGVSTMVGQGRRLGRAWTILWFRLVPWWPR